MSRVAVKNANDPRQVKNAERETRERERQRRRDLAAVLATAAGRRVLWALMTERTHPLSSTYRPNSVDHAYATGLCDASRRLWCELWDQHTDALVLMKRENDPTQDDPTLDDAPQDATASDTTQHDNEEHRND